MENGSTGHALGDRRRSASRIRFLELWRQFEGADVALTGTETSEVSFLAPANDNLLFEVTATDE